MKQNNISVVVIGGGAAGFFVAINCVRNNPACEVIILEKSNKLLSKVRVSGGGRCNVTHACFDNKVLAENYPRGNKELRSAFSRFSVNETIEWFKASGVRLQAEEDGRMFPETNNSETIINCFMKEAEKLGVKIKMGYDVKCLIPAPSPKEKGVSQFQIVNEEGEVIYADKVIVATGGHPKKDSYQWLKETGHLITEPVPSLFTFNIPDDSLTKLMGVSVPEATVKIKNTALENSGPLLITHWGLSGPAVLKLSAWGARTLYHLNYDFEIAVNWLEKIKENELREKFAEVQKQNAPEKIFALNPFSFPKRLWHYLLNKAGIKEETRYADLSKKMLNSLLQSLLADTYPVKGKTTFKEEFVTCGGIKLEEIDFKTMQSRVCPGLYFAGEVLDVDGVTGGFNFQNAWSTAWICAQAISNS